MSHSVLRRYTPPTCTLEISAKQSPLSRWAGQSVLKHVRFQLSLDDPKLPQEQWITLRGDRAQLDALSDTVQTYVQTLLGQSVGRAGTTELPDAGANLFQGRSALAVVDAAPPATSNAAGILLQPDGLLAHRLILGSLGTEASGTIVRLSTLQLFDLANALEEYAADGLVLPNLQSPNWLRTTPAWGKIAAVSLLTIGLAASVAKLVDNTGSVQSNAPTSSQGASSSDQKIATQIPSSESLPTVPGQSPLGSNQPLPPPPPPGSTTVPTQPGMPTITLPKAAPVAPPANQQSTARSSGPATLPDRPTIIIPEAGPSGSGRSTVPNPSIAANPRPQNPSADPGAASFESGSPSETSRAAKAPEPPSIEADIPQVAEAKQFFQERWSPPQTLKQTLEYQLTINANGSISAIVPLGQAAGDYIDRTGIPPFGEAFVSPLKRGNSARIRLVLRPDGTVETLLEALN